MVISEEVKLERIKQKELKAKIKEFTKKNFVYQQNDPQIPEKVKQELTKLGAFKPFYAEDENERIIKLIKMLDSEETWIRLAFEVEVRKYFSTNLTDTLTLVSAIRDYQHNLMERMRKIKEAKERKKYEYE